MEAGITKSNYCNVYGDENDACFIATEEGISKVISAVYPVMIIHVFHYNGSGNN